jgi:hypothetical protein
VARSYLGSGYLFRNQAAVRKLIAVANTADSTVIDRVWNPLFDTKAMIAYAVMPNPIWQRDTPSNILRDEANSITRDRVYQLLQAENQTGALSNIKVYKKTQKPVGFTSHNFVSAEDAAAVAGTANATVTKKVEAAAGSGKAASLRGSGSDSGSGKGSDSGKGRGSGSGTSKGGGKDSRDSKDKATGNKSTNKTGDSKGKGKGKGKGGASER